MSLPTEDKARKELQYWTFLTEYFLKAWMAVANVAIAGNKQHNPGQKLHWAREKSTDQMNTAFRHQLDYAMGVKKDTDGQWHLAKAIWRLSAQLQLDIEEDEKCQARQRKLAEDQASGIGSCSGQFLGAALGLSNPVLDSGTLHT